MRFQYEATDRAHADSDDEREDDANQEQRQPMIPTPMNERDRASWFFRRFLERLAAPVIHIAGSSHDAPVPQPREEMQQDAMQTLPQAVITVVDGGMDVETHDQGDATAAVQESAPQAETAPPPGQDATGDAGQDGVAMEDSNTDDEDLQQLSMVMYNGLANQFDADPVSIFQQYLPSELCYDSAKDIVFQAVKEQKTALVDKLFKLIKSTPSGADAIARLVRAEDEAGLTMLMISVRHELLDLCEMLVNEGADVNQWNEKRPYALLLAAQKGHEAATRFLLERGADDESKSMSLIPAAHFGHIGVVRVLLEFGADQNYSNKKGTTPLMRAAQEGRDEVVQFLIDKGAVASAANNEGMTALMLAAQRGHASIATILIKAGSDVDTQTRQGSTALLLAAKRGHTQAVEALMTAGADIFLKDDRHKTAADTAHRRGHVELYLKITVSNQIRLMREALRRERYAELMRVSHLYVLSRATLAPAFQSPERQLLNGLLDRTMRLPRPLLQNIALYLPFCNVWDRQLKYLSYDAPSHPSKVVQHGIRILDEILVNVVLDVRHSLESFRRSHPQVRGRHLALLRDSTDFQDIFTDECQLPLCPDLLAKLRRMADIQGALASYAAGIAITFGAEVAQDVVALVSDLLAWDEARKRATFQGTVIAADVDLRRPQLSI